MPLSVKHIATLLYLLYLLSVKQVPFYLSVSETCSESMEQLTDVAPSFVNRTVRGGHPGDPVGGEAAAGPRIRLLRGGGVVRGESRQVGAVFFGSEWADVWLVRIVGVTRRNRGLSGL
jgi:hypothetical protein